VTEMRCANLSYRPQANEEASRATGSWTGPPQVRHSPGVPVERL